MKYNYLNVIGLMTGTSMDGIDVSLVRTNGINLERLNKNYLYKYNKKTKDLLLNILKLDNKSNLKKIEQYDELITNEHFKALKYSGFIEEADLIGFHGQTIYHNPKSKISLQLGNAKKLAKMSNKKVVFDFRSKDIEIGGEGAPLAPIYHKFIMEKTQLELPSCILNIGGVANLTFWDGKNLIGFDTGPGNALMDTYIKSISNKYYDKNGNIASKGSPNKYLVNEFLSHIFFKKLPPKSLDRNSFIGYYKKLLDSHLSEEDIMATLSSITVESIKISLNLLPKKIKNIMVTGGGYRNKYLIKSLKDKLNINFITESDINLNFDFIESELIAFLSARSLYDLPFTFPSTTGASFISSGGKICGPL